MRRKACKYAEIYQRYLRLKMELLQGDHVDANQIDKICCQRLDINYGTLAIIKGRAKKGEL